MFSKASSINVNSFSRIVPGAESKGQMYIGLDSVERDGKMKLKNLEKLRGKLGKRESGIKVDFLNT